MNGGRPGGRLSIERGKDEPGVGKKATLETSRPMVAGGEMRRIARKRDATPL